MPAKKTSKKARPKKKAAKAARKPTKKKVARKRTPAKPAGPQFACILCGVEVAVTRSGLGISRLMCCGQPMSRR